MYKNDGDFDVYISIADVPELNIVQVYSDISLCSFSTCFFSMCLFFYFDLLADRFLLTSWGGTFSEHRDPRIVEQFSEIRVI